LHFSGRGSGKAPVRTAEKMRACADSVKSHEKTAGANSFIALGHALFEFSVKIFFCAREIFTAFFLVGFAGDF
jgi:hypothetical protein